MTTSTNTTYKYRYDDGGNRIFKDAQGKKEYYFRDDLGHEVAVYDVTTDRLKMINLYGSDLIGRIDVSWNYSTRSDARKFYVKDHLGSIRQTLNESGVVQSAMDYYAFGGTLSSYVNGSTVDKYRFTSKERDLETGLDYFGARYYDSKIGRWMSVDPLSESRPGLSPYNYCQNNPLLRIDLTGMLDEVLEFDQNGNYTGRSKDDGKKEISGAIVNEEGETTMAFSFLDQSDAVSIKNGSPNVDGKVITGIDMNFESSLKNTVNEGLSKLSGGPLLLKLPSIIGNSLPGGSLDYYTTIKDVTKLSMIGKMAYNAHDAGNYMWGMAMKALGLSPSQAQQAARIYERVWNQREDQSTDQIAIWNGATRR